MLIITAEITNVKSHMNVSYFMFCEDTYSILFIISQKEEICQELGNRYNPPNGTSLRRIPAVTPARQVSCFFNRKYSKCLDTMNVFVIKQMPRMF